MKSIRTLCGEYREEDIYNIDETGLFWRQSINRGLASTSQPGVKRKKTRISIICYVNSTGSDRLPLWLIGKSKKPRCFKNVNLNALSCVWRAN